MTNIPDKKSLLFKALVLAARFIPAETTLPVVAGPLRGLRWIAGAAAGEGKGLSILVNGAEPGQLQIARDLIRPDSICFDIGANVGLYTLLFATYGKCVYAFEPLPRNISFLHRMISLNKLKNVTLVPCAVSDDMSLASFSEGDNCATGKLRNTGTQPVATVSCDQIAAKLGVSPSLIKIDVEGAEMKVLQGARETLNSRPKPVILLSTHGRANHQGCIDILKQAGYSDFTPLNGETIMNCSEMIVRAEAPSA